MLTRRYTWKQFNNLHWKAFSIDPVITFFNEIFTNLGYMQEGGYFYLENLQICVVW